jgi:hypothetical protein
VVGRRGTDINCNNHVAGDYFIPFDRQRIQSTPIQTAHVAADVSVAAVGQGTTKAATIITNALEGESLKPWAITYVKAVRQP